MNAAEIKLRATMRIGELVRELDTASNQYALPSTEKSKSAAIKDAGLSVSTAHRYQELAGPRDTILQNVAAAPP